MDDDKQLKKKRRLERYIKKVKELTKAIDGAPTDVKVEVEHSSDNDSLPEIPED